MANIHLRLVLAALLYGFTAMPAYAAETACYRSAEAHACLSATNPKVACEEEITTDPYNLQARFSLCEALLQQKNTLNAWVVLDQGLKLCGRNKAACSRLQIALSNLEEGSEQASKDTTAAERTRLLAQQDSQRRVCQRRMNGDLSLNACNELLISFPEDPALYTALAAKLLNRGKPADAIVHLEQARKFGADPATLSPLLESAKTERSSLATQCLKEANLDQCNRALLVGGKDEVTLQIRRAELLRASGNRDAAIEALLIAADLEPEHAQLAKQLLALLPKGTLAQARTAAARGQALLATGNADGAIADLNRALALGADSSDIVQPLRRARALRAQTVDRDCLAQQQIAPCESMLLAGEPDEQKIRDHIAAINKRAAQAQVAIVQTAAQQQPSESVLAIEHVSPTQNDAVSQINADSVRKVASTYGNQATELGITY